MARYVFRERNPEVLGVEVEDIGAGILGLSATALGNDKLVAPVLDRFVPTLKGRHVLRKIVDAGTTLGVAYLYRLSVGMVDRHWARVGQFGGSLLGGSRFVTAFFPGYQISSVTPVDAEVGALVTSQNVNAAKIAKNGANQAVAGQINPVLTQSVPTEETQAFNVGSPAYSFKGGA